MKKLILISALFFSFNGFSDELSYYQQYTNLYCQENPYNCKFDGSIVGVAVDDFLKQFYKEVDREFANAGYTDVQFEYCIRERRCYRVIDGENIEMNTGWTNNHFVKNGPYEITKQYPPSKAWYRANGGVNKSLGINFYKTLSPAQYDEHCTNRYKSGRALNKNIILNKDIKFSEVFDYYKEDSKVLYRTYLPNLVGFDPKIIQYLESSCLIVDKRIFFPTKLQKDVSFRITKKTILFYGQ